ncbi:MAG: tetratricopeptide repeat protein, partial [Planctomycetota bacterium]
MDPKYASAWDGLGTLYAGQNRNELALEHFNKAIELDPENLSAQFSKGIVLESLKRDKTAIKTYLGIIKQDTSHLQSRYRLVDLYVQAGDFKKAAAQA